MNLIDKILCILDLRENVHYSLERLPVIQRILQPYQVNYKCIYDFENEFGRLLAPENVNKKFVSYVLDNKFKFILIVSELFAYISPETILTLSQNGIVIASFLGDDENNFNININYLGLLSIPISYQYTQYLEYIKINPHTERIPISVSFYDTDRYCLEDKYGDVLFVGKPYGCRPKLLKFLIDNGVKLTVYGHEKWAKHFTSKTYKGFVDNAEYYYVCARHKIVLALLESPKNTDILHVNAKIFDAAKVGSALIVTRYNQLFSDYGLYEGEDLLAYDSKEELLVQINKLLASEELRIKLANNLRSKIRDKFDYEVLYKKLFSRILNVSCSIPTVTKVRILWLDSHKQSTGVELENYDYVIYKGKHVNYSKAIAWMLAAHKGSNKMVKLDSMYHGRLARKIFNYVDVASLAIPITRINSLKRYRGVVMAKDSVQSYLALNHYLRPNLYIILLVLIRTIYKSFL